MYNLHSRLDKKEKKNQKKKEKKPRPPLKKTSSLKIVLFPGSVWSLFFKAAVVTSNP